MTRLRTQTAARPVDHASYIGGSDVGALLGLDPFKNALDVWAEKRRLFPPSPSSEPMLMGLDMEAGVLAAYARRVGVKPGALERPGTLRSPGAPHLGATPDAVRLVNKRGGIVRVVQAKLVGFGGMHSWGPEEDGEDAVPPSVVAQVTWEAARLEDCSVCVVDRCDVVAAIGTSLRIYPVAFDRTFAAELAEVVDAFWTRHVIGGEMPEVNGRRELLARLHPKPTRALEDATPATLALVREYAEMRETVKRAEWVQDRLADELCVAIGEGEGFAGPWGKATWGAQDRRSTDWKGLAAELGIGADAIAKHTKTETGRVLRVNLKGER